jgi:hypothetical protein
MLCSGAFALDAGKGSTSDPAATRERVCGDLRLEPESECSGAVPRGKYIKRYILQFLLICAGNLRF